MADGRGSAGADSAIAGSSGASRRGWRGRARSRSNTTVAVVGNAKLGGPLVGTVRIVDELEAVAAVASGLKVRSRGPAVGASVGDLLSDGVERKNVLRWALEQHDGDSACGRWLPCDCVLGSSGHNLVQAWLSDWVAAICALGGLLLCQYQLRVRLRAHDILG